MEIDDPAAVDWITLEIGHDTPWDRYTICYCVFFVLYMKWILTTVCDRLFHLAYLSS
ncbi:hypothetical protein Hanom_Chr06g00538751 [Helianthus anomalus]